MYKLNNAGRARLAWKFPFYSWEVWVDAANGQILKETNYKKVAPPRIKWDPKLLRTLEAQRAKENKEKEAHRARVWAKAIKDGFKPCRVLPAGKKSKTH